ncbi:MAG TPA: glutamate--tRNA ligase [Candidatus Nanoarchaeia archaeon]|nr:glutamate--tRNA ligase [Candidatus Nanoarchaeia archaeon]
MKDIILKYALQNAVQFNGKANQGSVIGKVIGERPELKSDMKALAIETGKTIKEISSLSVDQQLEKLKQIAPELLEKKEKEEKDIFAFLNIKPGEKVVTCFPPEPSKYPHIGHAKAILLNYELAKRNKGMFILRFEDTNPLLAEKHLYEVHLENYRWLGIHPDKVENASDYMDQFYQYAEQLIGKGNAYLCTCSQESIKDGRYKGIDCPCRSNPIEKNKELWKKFQTSKEEEMILRLKADMQSSNTVMRDPTLMRVIDHPHALTGTKYRLWPTYDFENSVMDGIQGTTHRLRTKEFELRNEAQRFLQRLLGFKETIINEFGRFNMEGIESSGRIIREKVKSGELLGWDDPSLNTLVALRRRGFQPSAIKEFVFATGITKNETVMTWDDLYSHNRKAIDKTSNRYFFVENPKKVTIKGAPKQKVELKLHPDFPERGKRAYETHEEFCIAQKDYDSLEEGKLYRLMDCLNFVMEKKEEQSAIGKFHSSDYDTYKKEGKRIMHFVPASENVIDTQILMPDKTIIAGVSEPLVGGLHADTVIQFERFGFARLDKKEGQSAVFWYTHK